MEGCAGRSHTSPQLLVSLWSYGYGRGVSSAQVRLRGKSEYEPGLQWLCGLEPVSHRTLSGFRSDYKAALEDLFIQVVGMLSAEGLVTMERVTQDGTKIKANAGGNVSAQEKLEAHLALARAQVERMNAQCEEQEQWDKRQAGASAVPHVSGRAVWKQPCKKWIVCNKSASMRAIRLWRERPRLIQKLMLCATEREARFPAITCSCSLTPLTGFIVDVAATTDATDYRR